MLNSPKPLTIVIFGATGNLYADKLAKSLFILFKKGNILSSDFKIIAFARRDFSNDTFRSYTKESILKRGPQDSAKLDAFLEHLEYFRGDFSEKDDFLKLKNFLSQDRNRSILFHIATPSSLYKTIFENMKIAELNHISEQSSMLIEKPFGTDEKSAKRLNDILLTLFNETQIFHVDHYLAKETVLAISDFRFKHGTLENIWNNENIEKIKIIFHESNIVGSRGASYDAVGAFRDVGENHMLELLVLSVMDNPAELTADSIRNSRTKALQELCIDQKHKPTRGQYAGYLESPNVQLDSQTETFFRIFLQSKNPRFASTLFELEGGKGLIDMHSDITTTTVAVEVYFRNGNQKEFKIQPVFGTVYDSYIKIYEDVIRSDQTLFVSMEEIMAEWKLTDEVMNNISHQPLVIYKQGSKAEDIK